MMRRAADARFELNRVLFRVQQYGTKGVSEKIDVSNTEGVPGNPAINAGLSGQTPFGFNLPKSGRCAIGDIPQTMIMLRTATWDEAHNPYVGAFLVVLGGWVVLRWFPSGLGGPAYGPWNCLVLSTDHTGEVGRGAQPVSLELCTDGEIELRCR